MRNKLIFVGMFIIACGIFGGLIVPQIMKSDDCYTGKEVFNSESDYTNFKQALVASGAIWDVSNGGDTYIQALSSSPPIIVNFNVRVKQGVNFPYGKRKDEVSWNLGLGIFLFCLIVVVLYMVSWFWNDDDVWYLFRKSKDKMVNK
jgi:hypothetical protein